MIAWLNEYSIKRDGKMKESIKRRVNGDVTRLKILRSARKLFAKQGFAATSIQRIALEAGVNQSLIPHHFGNKEALWKSVKLTFIEAEGEVGEYQLSSLKGFLNQVIYQRFEIYSKNPDLVRMMQWQRMEPKSKQVIGGNQLAPSAWSAPIDQLKKAGLIKSKQKTESLIVMIASLVDGVTMPGVPYCKTHEEKEKYLEFLVDSLVKILV